MFWFHNGLLKDLNMKPFKPFTDCEKSFTAADWRAVAVLYGETAGQVPVPSA